MGAALLMADCAYLCLHTSQNSARRGTPAARCALCHCDKQSKWMFAALPLQAQGDSSAPPGLSLSSTSQQILRTAQLPQFVHTQDRLIQLGNALPADSWPAVNI